MEYERFRRDFLGVQDRSQAELPLHRDLAARAQLDLDADPDARFLQLTDPPAYARLCSTAERIADRQLEEERRVGFANARRLAGEAIDRKRPRLAARQAKREREAQRDPLAQNWAGFAAEQRGRHA